ncbi:uncharacterized protein LOC123680729 [Harmonia axyridis]|uniref:uncharacterized protein LOC123680729 n=1 Tax=Harmonia axyridis TaxID=115357 RepID=UPI001E276A19|nr:uncharacterized protein LOC123680729 [Harmonia axyridis]
MNQLNENKYPTDSLLYNFVEDESLLAMIDEEESISNLICLLQLQVERIKLNMSQKHNFPVAKILKNNCPLEIKISALNLALDIQTDNAEFIYCLLLLNEQLSLVESTWNDVGNLSRILCLATVIIRVNQQVKEDIFTYVDKFKLKMFLFKLCGTELSKDFLIDKSSLFFKYFELIIKTEEEFIDQAVQYFIEQENLDYLCMLFDKKLSNLVTSDYFQEDNLWNFLKLHIVSKNSVKKKQAQYILFRTVEYFKTNETATPRALQVTNLKEWDFFFILLEMSKEKQLHLIQPTLKLLPSIKDLHITWRICLYQELLNHSQLTVVYNMIEHVLGLKFTSSPIYQRVVSDILIALNKYEYSFLTRRVFNKLEVFCNELNEVFYPIFYEEFLKIDWNPAAAWCVLKSASFLLHKIPKSLIIKMLRCLKKLPHMYIKQSCIIFFIEKLLEDSSDILEKVILIGRFLFSTDQQIDKEIFYQIIEKKISELRLCTENLKKSTKQYIEEENTEYLLINLQLMKKLNLDIEYEVKSAPCNLDDMILFYFPNLLRPFHVGDYIVKRFQNEHNDDYQYLLKFLEIMIENDLVKISSDECLKIWHNSQSNGKKLIASYLIYRIPNTLYVDSTILPKVELYLKHIGCEVWLKKFRKSFDIIKNEKQFNNLIQKFGDWLDTDNENLLKLIVDNLDLVTNYFIFNETGSIGVLDICLRKICRLSNNLMRTYSSLFFESIFEFNLFSTSTFAECWKKWYSDLFECYFMECDSLLKVIMEGCRKIILLEAPHMGILTPLILGALTKGIVIQKNQRVEYGICQAIHEDIGSLSVQNPNLIATDLKILSIECLYLLAKNKSMRNIPSADVLMEMLVDHYMVNYNKRYFPESKIHLEKLRIVQAMLMIVHFTDRSREKLVEFIMKSFCEETHQTSVKQLLQWLLIILVSQSPSYLSLMIEKVETTNLSNTSSVVALIPVVYHLVTSLKDEECWYQATNALLPWTMGANFKLRVYSQVTLRNILKRAKQNQLTKYIDKYSFLENSISAVLDATGNAVSETLKNDMTFIEALNPDLHYSVENIFVALPKMLDVPPSEWQNVLKHKFCEQFEMKLKTEMTLPNIVSSKNFKEENEYESTCVNVQKKIIPWKQDLEEKIENKSLNSLICVASLVEKYSNIGGLSRTCEIFNVQHLVLHNMKIKDDREFKSLSMSSENWVDFMEVKKDELSSFLIKLKEQGFAIVGLEQTSESVKLHDFKFEKKTVILLGNEKEGIPAPLLPFLDTCVEIPQFGQTRSLNVHVAGATFIWEYVKQHML